MKILMLNYEFPPLGGGGGIAAKKLAEGFIQLGYEVDYVTSGFKGLKQYEKIDGINVYRVNVIARNKLETASLLSLFSFPLMGHKKCKELIKINNYDFINTHFVIPTGLLGNKLSKKYGIPNILTVIGGDVYDPTKILSGNKNFILRFIIKNVIENSDYVTAISNNIKDCIIKYYNPTKDIKVIPLAYKHFKFKKVSRSKLGLKKNVFYLISVGRLVKRKGFDFLIRSIANLRNDDIHLLIVGDGPEKNNLIKLTKEKGILEKVHFLGFVSEEKKFQYLSNSDVYILPSIHEGFGIVLQEAMQVGLPIISTNNGGQVDLINDRINGFLINYGDEKELINTIKIFFENKKLKNKISKNNYHKLKEFNLEDVSKGYLSLLR